MPKIRKKTSSRGTTRLRERIKHKAKESRHKAKKASKKDVTWKSRVKKDPGIPNLFPYKEQLLLEAQKAKEQRELEKQSRKIANQEADDTTASTSVAALAAQTAEDDADFEDIDDADEDGMDLPADPSLSSSASLRAYARSLRKVLSLSDVIIEVLDARDPLGTRSFQLEKEALQQGKKLVLVLNKVDLVPKENVEAWLAYLRRSWPTLPFKSSTQSQRSNLSSRGGDAASRSGGSAAASSTQPLMQLLKNYSRHPHAVDQSGNPAPSGPSVRTSITVGVIGFPNVGKSSLINTLKRSRACGVAPTPGYTKDVQEVTIEKGLKVLDCPGVVVDIGKDGDAVSAERVLRNAVKVEQVLDPLGPVSVILHRCRPEHLMILYGIAAFSHEGQTVDERTRDFLVQVARSRGRVKKGGVPDVISAARGVLRDWNMGKIPYYTVPPPLPAVAPTPTIRTESAPADPNAMQTDDVGTAKIVTELAPAFDLEALFAAADGQALQDLRSKKEMGSVVKMDAPVVNHDAGGLKLLGETDEVEEDEVMDDVVPNNKRKAADVTEAPQLVSLPPKKSKRVAFDDSAKGGSSATAQRARMGIAEETEGIGQNRAIAKNAKKDKRKKAKTAAREAAMERLGDQDDEMAEDGAVEDRPYSFSEFFATA